jgi:hypothetical protein
MTELIISPYRDPSDWLTQLGQTYNALRREGWRFLLCLRAGIDQFGRSDERRMQLYEAASEQLNLQVTTLQNYVSIARKEWVNTAINLGLELGHADAVKGLDDEQAEGFLVTAAEQKLSVAGLRFRVREFRIGYAPVNSAGDDVPFSDPYNELYSGGGPEREVCPTCGRKLV